MYRHSLPNISPFGTKPSISVKWQYEERYKSTAIVSHLRFCLRCQCSMPV